MTVDELAARIGAEVRRGLVDATENPGRGVSIPFGEGVDILAAVWGAVARVREIATMRSGGGVRFEATGPEGAIPLAPWTGGDRRAGERGIAAARLDDGVRLEGRRAVVVDDDPSVVWFLSGLLRGAGVEVLEAHDGAQALELVVTTWPDVVISDVLMPKMDGFTLCREIKRDIAVRDVPVILLSWKEDLLQRVRELGAGADGYLRKEATGGTVLERVREVLRPRARVESRLAGDGGVRGRLDGLTPRLILELACARRGDCRVSVRDAVYLYEVEIRGGKPVQATRTASDGSFERGARVVAGLLGVSAGRFVITPNSAPARDNFKSSLDDLLAGPVRRARSAQRLLSGKALLSVESVDIDVAAVAAYVASTPDPAHSLTQRLVAGESPRDIVLSGDASAEMVELVLTDVARHGGVRAVVSDGAPIDLDAAPPAHVVQHVSQPHVRDVRSGFGAAPVHLPAVTGAAGRGVRGAGHRGAVRAFADEPSDDAAGSHRGTARRRRVPRGVWDVSGCGARDGQGGAGEGQRRGAARGPGRSRVRHRRGRSRSDEEPARGHRPRREPAADDQERGAPTAAEAGFRR